MDNMDHKTSLQGSEVEGQTISIKHIHVIINCKNTSITINGNLLHISNHQWYCAIHIPAHTKINGLYANTA